MNKYELSYDELGELTEEELERWLQLKAFLGYYESGEKYDNEMKKLRKVINEYKESGLLYDDYGNNVCNDLTIGAIKLGANVSISSPRRYFPKKRIIKIASELAEKHKVKFELTTNPIKAVQNADVVITDSIISMGMEKEKKIN